MVIMKSLKITYILWLLNLPCVITCTPESSSSSGAGGATGGASAGGGGGGDDEGGGVVINFSAFSSFSAPSGFTLTTFFFCALPSASDLLEIYIKEKL